MSIRSLLTVGTLPLLVVAAALSRPPLASATVDMQKKAKAAGFKVDGCVYCHVEKLPKKGAVTHNARGEYLIAQKDKNKAKEVDVAWLKDYVEKK